METAELPAGADVATDEDPIEAQARAEREALNPCKVCGFHQHEGPEGERHVFPHCWRCGYRPSQPMPAGAALAQPGLQADQIDTIVAELRRGIAEDVKAMLEAGARPEDVSVRLEDGGQPAADQPGADQPGGDGGGA